MAYPAWPSTLPSNPFGQGEAVYVPSENTIRSQPEVGPAKVRRRFTGKHETMQFRLNLNRAKRETLMTFYRTTLQEVLPFTWVDFRTGAAATYRFTRAPAEKYFAGDGEWWEIGIELELMP